MQLGKLAWRAMSTLAVSAGALGPWPAGHSPIPQCAIMLRWCEIAKERWRVCDLVLVPTRVDQDAGS